MDYVSFPRIDDDALGTIVTGSYYLPARTRAERYIRAYAPDLYQHKHLLARAYAHHYEPTLLVPVTDLDEEMAQAIHGGRILDVPVQVVDGLDEAMLAYSLKRTLLP